MTAVSAGQDNLPEPAPRAWTNPFRDQKRPMPIIRHLEELPESARGGAVAIGNFDGVHLGHRRIVQQLLKRAAEVGGPAVVFTFDPHPVRLLRPAECPPPLTWTERKAQLLAALGVHRVVAYPTDERLLALTAREFFDSIVGGALAARAVVEGPNFYFGHNREGDVALLGRMATAAGMTLDVVEPVVLAGEIVSSSRVRRLVAAGDVAEAAELLAVPYRIRGMVTHGAGRGAKIGFATANLAGVDTLLPAAGVYAGRALFDGEACPAAINLGPNPTFGESALKVEVHILDRVAALYGRPLEVEFIQRLRDVVQFGSKEELVSQLRKDVDAVRSLFGAG
ncbi:MAG TPA: bifunctional riboflavin kinase/FAD synthetase [Lacipirellulaceae bacterium]|nr:bifunctional riboflavin kinase/FAD synthetase [Lacipirellulaceae bacterium]